MNMLRYLSLFLCFSAYIYGTKQCKQINPDVLQVLEDVIDDIYHLNTQEVQEMVQQDFGCIPEISAEKLYHQMHENEDLLVVNVLSEKWYHDCHIEGSINVPLDQLIHLVKDWDRAADIVVYCALSACDAGEKAYVLLRCMGFDNVVDYHGGIKEWFQLGYPIVGPCASEYLHKDVSRCPSHLMIPFDLHEAIKKTRYIKRFRNRCTSL